MKVQSSMTLFLLVESKDRYIKSHTLCIAVGVTQSLAVDQRPKQPAPPQDFHTMAPTQRDTIDFQEQQRNMPQAPPPQPQQNFARNWSANQQQQRQQQPMDERYRDMAPMDGAQHAPQYGGGGAPGGGAQRRTGELRSPPTNQPQHNVFPMDRNQHIGGKSWPLATQQLQHNFFIGGHWSGGQQPAPVQAWSENRRHSSETSQPQSPLKKPEPVKPTPAKKAPVKSAKQLGNYLYVRTCLLHPFNFIL